MDTQATAPLIVTPNDVQEAPGPLTAEQINEICTPGPVQTINSGRYTIHFGTPYVGMPHVGIPVNIVMTAFLHHVGYFPASVLITGNVVITKD